MVLTKVGGESLRTWLGKAPRKHNKNAGVSLI